MGVSTWQTLSGLTTIRAYRAEGFADHQFSSAAADNCSFAFAKSALDQWIFTQVSVVVINDSFRWSIARAIARSHRISATCSSFTSSRYLSECE